MVTKTSKETEMDTEAEALSTPELGGILIKHRAAMDAAEAEWLLLLAEFDRRCGWVIDGHHDAVSWLADKCGLARSTAYERLRVAHELTRRPVLAEAFAAGQVSFAKIRIMTRIVDLGDECDRYLLEAGTAGT